MNNNKKTAFVLSGGGAKGAFQVGAMSGLKRKLGVVPDALYGTSVGALNAVGYAYSGLDGLTRIWQSIRSRRDILRLNTWKLLTLQATGLFRMDPIRKKIESIVGSYRTTPVIKAQVCYTDLNTGRVLYAKAGEVWEFAKYVEASAAIPGVMEAVDGRYVDGGVREMTPLKKAIDDGATDIYVIMANSLGPMGKWKKTRWLPKIAQVAMRSVEMIEHEIMINDINTCQQVNKDLSEGKRYINLTMLSPSKPLIGTLEFKPQKINQSIEQGYNAVPG